MASGVTLHEDCLTKFKTLKLENKTHQYKYITFKLNEDNTQIIVDKTSSATDWEAFKTDLPELEPRYAVYDFEYEADGGAGKRKKLVFFYWSPDDAKIKQKMVYSSSKEALRKALVGIAAEVQANDAGDLEYEEVVKKAKKGN